MTAHMLRTLLAVLCMAVLTAACQRTEPAWTPPAYGTDKCAACGAVIAASRYAAQLQRADGAVLSFDDPVCLMRTQKGEAPGAVRFHDEREDGWSDGTRAWFARVPGQTSPKGEGWAAFSGFAAAQDAVAGAGSGEILPFDQARERLGR